MVHPWEFLDIQVQLFSFLVFQAQIFTVADIPKVQDDLVPGQGIREIRDGRHHRQQHQIIRQREGPGHPELLRYPEERDQERLGQIYNAPQV